MVVNGFRLLRNVVSHWETHLFSYGFVPVPMALSVELDSARGVIFGRVILLLLDLDEISSDTITKELVQKLVDTNILSVFREVSVDLCAFNLFEEFSLKIFARASQFCISGSSNTEPEDEVFFVSILS
ncbi:hypothetical protein Tco_0150172 [Tanacetum coccineum]